MDEMNTNNQEGVVDNTQSDAGTNNVPNQNKLDQNSYNQQSQNTYSQMNQTVYTQNPNNMPKKNGKATASMVCGIVGLAVCCTGCVLGVIAIVLSYMYSQETGDYNNPSAKAGKICGIVAIPLSAFAYLFYLIYYASFFSRFY